MTFALSLILSALLGTASNQTLSVDIRCFSDADRKIQLELRTYSDKETGWVGGQVRYRRSNEFIPLVVQHSTPIQDSDVFPAEVEHLWHEIVGGSITGEYQMTGQGANIYSFKYTNRKTGRTFDISEQSFPDESGHCWATPTPTS